MLESAQGFGVSPVDQDDDDQVNLSIGARLLRGAESLLSRSLVSKLTELAPENVGKRIEQLQREILLSGSGMTKQFSTVPRLLRRIISMQKKPLKKPTILCRS